MLEEGLHVQWVLNSKSKKWIKSCLALWRCQGAAQSCLQAPTPYLQFVVETIHFCTTPSTKLSKYSVLRPRNKKRRVCTWVCISNRVSSRLSVRITNWRPGYDFSAQTDDRRYDSREKGRCCDRLCRTTLGLLLKCNEFSTHFIKNLQAE